ncbi:unnamed protein product [Brassica oleracea]
MHVSLRHCLLVCNLKPHYCLQTLSTFFIICHGSKYKVIITKLAFLDIF